MFRKNSRFGVGACHGTPEASAAVLGCYLGRCPSCPEANAGSGPAAIQSNDHGLARSTASIR
ncbi:hypothetical protein COL940_009958 [Colletotrichum noveboracense]|nr:hypothetical protein COL940_009958 [Colletotrichum noveboracense]